MANGNGYGLTINGSTLTKVLASMNAVLLAVSIVVIGLASTTVVGHGEDINDLKTNVAVIQGNRFTSSDALEWERRVEDDVKESIMEMRAEMNSRFDRLEARLNRGGGAF